MSINNNCLCVVCSGKASKKEIEYFNNVVDPAFKKAFKEKLFKEDEPYMFMGQDENYIYFKHGITRQYKNLIKESVGK